MGGSNRHFRQKLEHNEKLENSPFQLITNILCLFIGLAYFTFLLMSNKNNFYGFLLEKTYFEKILQYIENYKGKNV